MLPTADAATATIVGETYTANATTASELHMAIADAAYRRYRSDSAIFAKPHLDWDVFLSLDC